MKQTKKNPLYKVPEVTVYLGTVLDLDIETREHRLRVDAFDGFNLLVPENAEILTPGRGKIYIVKGELKKLSDESESSDEGEQTYETWTGREPDAIAELNTPDSLGYYQGRVTRIGYTSDRGAEKGQFEDYDHYFIEEGGISPRIYTDRADLDKATSAILVGGDFVITSRGIE